MRKKNIFQIMTKSIATILAIGCFFTFGLTSNAQEFMGVDVGGQKSQIIKKFKAKGFRVDGDEKKDAIMMRGKANNMELELIISCSPISKKVWKVSVYLPKQDTWEALKEQYDEYLENLSDKYGKPESTYTGFAEGYKEGEGDEMEGVEADKCIYSAYWKPSKGISIKISQYKQIKIGYENEVNSKIDDQEKKKIKTSIF